MWVLVLTLVSLIALAALALAGVLALAERTRPPALTMPEPQARNIKLYATGTSAGWVQPQA